jgi:hypothetical protein
LHGGHSNGGRSAFALGNHSRLDVQPFPHGLAGLFQQVFRVDED